MDRGSRSNGLLTPRTGRVLAPASTASARSSPSICRSGCSSSSSAPVGATGANPQSDIGVPTCDLRRDRPGLLALERCWLAHLIGPPLLGIFYPRLGRHPAFHPLC